MPRDSYPEQLPNRRYALLEWPLHTRNVGHILVPPPLAGHASFLVGEGYRWGEWERFSTNETLVAWRIVLATSELPDHLRLLVSMGYEIRTTDLRTESMFVRPAVYAVTFEERHPRAIAFDAQTDAYHQALKPPC